MSSDKKEVHDPLSAENAQLRAELAQLRGRLQSARQANIGATLTQTRPASYLSSKKESGNSEGGEPDLDAHLSIVVLGASGDLAVKKTYPALFALYRHGLMPKKFSIVGYARSDLKDDEFKEKISSKFDKKYADKKSDFLKNCWYKRGQYDKKEDFAALDKDLTEAEEKAMGSSSGGKGPALNRIFYMALPPTAFVPAAKSIHAAARTKKGWNRLVVEKPFGRDLESSDELGRELSALFTEDEIYRIDHYLGKEMVQNLMVLRFANKVFEPLWNRDHINCVMITFKEDFGTQGRGGYFDNFGIIRDVMQNHMLQMLSIVAMEPPLSLSAEDVRDEKVKLLRAIAPITTEDTVIGQYTADPKGKEPGYLDDKDVPNDSVTPTFATSVLHINNSRWMGIPFIMKCGKALNEKKADIRIQFKHPINTLFDDLSSNELVLRVGPDEAVYLKMTTKEPGLDGGNRHAELDLTYKKRFNEEMQDLPDAYETLILDIIRGDHNLFVRSDELAAAWRIFTPLLHAIEKHKKMKPIKYEWGSRGPKESDKLIEQYGYMRTQKYQWEETDKIKRLGSPTLSNAKASLVKHEPPVLAQFVQAACSADSKADAFIKLFTNDGTVEAPGHPEPRSAKDHFTEFVSKFGGIRFVNKHKFIDPAQPNSAALYFDGQGDFAGKQVVVSVIEMLELTDDGTKIKKLRIFSDGPKAKL